MTTLTTFTPTQKELADALDDIALEIEQVIGICLHMIHHGPGPEQATAENQEAILEANVYLESFLLHARVLLDFFERPKRSVVRRGKELKELDDVLALDYGLPAEPIGIPQLLRDRLNKDLMHLSYSRTQRQGADRDWFPEPMARALLTRCDVFAEHLLKGAAPVELPEAGQARYHEIRQLVAALLQAPVA
jgi:hypothetical protein